jgi:hypothetical protein
LEQEERRYQNGKSIETIPTVVAYLPGNGTKIGNEKQKTLFTSHTGYHNVLPRRIHPCFYYS